MVRKATYRGVEGWGIYGTLPEAVFPIKVFVEGTKDFAYVVKQRLLDRETDIFRSEDA